MVRSKFNMKLRVICEIVFVLYFGLSLSASRFLFLFSFVRSFFLYSFGRSEADDDAAAAVAAI